MELSEQQPENPIILFDGICNLCNASIQQIISRDHQKLFRFASLQSALGEKTLKKLGVDPEVFDSVILLHKGSVHVKSDAVLKILSLMGGWRRLAIVLRVMPRVIRNLIYDWVALNRYRWFGKRAECMLPTPELEERFLSEL